MLPASCGDEHRRAHRLERARQGVRSARLLVRCSKSASRYCGGTGITLRCRAVSVELKYVNKTFLVAYFGHRPRGVDLERGP
jgi:hypothetical protein